MSEMKMIVLPYCKTRSRGPPINIGDYDIFLTPREMQEKVDKKMRRLNRKRIRVVAMVILVMGLLFGIYTVFGSAVALNEVGTAVSYFEASPVVQSVSHSQFVYYVSAWWSPSYGNPVQSMINAIYAAGLGFIIQGVADLIGAVLGYQPISGGQLVAFVAGALVAIFYAYSFGAIITEAGNAAIAAGATASEVLALTVAYGLVASIITYLSVYIAVVGAL